MFVTVIISFLKLERERFSLFVARRYYITVRTFLGVPEYLHDRSMSVLDRFRSFKTRNGHETFSHGQDYIGTVSERFETFAKSRSRTITVRSRFKNERITVIIS
jgi:hypothetical protein